MREYKFEERSVGNVLEDKAKTIGGKIYLLHGDMKITYKEINAGANRVAHSLLRLGIKKGDKVCVIMTNSVEYFHTWFALAKIGAVMVPINIALKGNLLRHIIQNSDATVVIADRDLVDRVAFLQDDIKKVKTIIIVPDYSEKEVGFTSDFALRKFVQLLRWVDGKSTYRCPFLRSHVHSLHLRNDRSFQGSDFEPLLSLCRPKQGKAVFTLPGGQCGLFLPSPFSRQCFHGGSGGHGC